MSLSDTSPSGPPPAGIKFIPGTDVEALDESFYQPSDEEREFLSQQTGISDPEELKKHVLQVQKEVYAIHAYPCIRAFAFVGIKVSRYPAYKDLLQLGKERPNALFLDIGCGVGNDTRKVVADGFPAKQVIASDLFPAFWDIGHKVFRSTPESFPVKFIPGDAFDEAFLETGPIVTEAPTNAPPIDVSALTSLTPVRGRLSAIHASAFFHLFNEEQQRELAFKLGSLLSPEPGSLIFGAHSGAAEKGVYSSHLRGQYGRAMFRHSPESWTALWEDVFGVGKVEVQAFLRDIGQQRPDAKHLVDAGVKIYFLVWSVKRL